MRGNLVGPLCSRNLHDKWGRRVASSFSCSRNTHDKGMEGHPCWSYAPGTEEGMRSDDPSCSLNARSRIPLAWASGTYRRASGCEGEKDPRNGRSISPILEERTRETGKIN